MWCASDSPCAISVSAILHAHSRYGDLHEFAYSRERCGDLLEQAWPTATEASDLARFEEIPVENVRHA